MREIKFRAWLTDSDGITYSNGSHMEYNITLVGGKYSDVESGWDIQGIYDYPVMQYTGLKDKNGVEIYEGDVIEFIQTHEDGSGNTLHLGVVTWEDGSLYSKSIKNEISRGMGGMSKNCTREVIGNIYENPELIK